MKSKACHAILNNKIRKRKFLPKQTLKKFSKKFVLTLHFSKFHFHFCREFIIGIYSVLNFLVAGNIYSCKCCVVIIKNGSISTSFSYIFTSACLKPHNSAFALSCTYSSIQSCVLMPGICLVGLPGSIEYLFSISFNFNEC